MIAWARFSTTVTNLDFFLDKEEAFTVRLITM